MKYCMIEILPKMLKQIYLHLVDKLQLPQLGPKLLLLLLLSQVSRHKHIVVVQLKIENLSMYQNLSNLTLDATSTCSIWPSTFCSIWNAFLKEGQDIFLQNHVCSYFICPIAWICSSFKFLDFACRTTETGWSIFDIGLVGLSALSQN